MGGQQLATRLHPGCGPGAEARHRPVRKQQCRWQTISNSRQAHLHVGMLKSGRSTSSRSTLTRQCMWRQLTLQQIVSSPAPAAAALLGHGCSCASCIGLPHSSGDTLRRHQRQASTAHPSSSLLVSCTRHSQEHASGTQASHSTPRAAHPQHNTAHLKPGTQRAQQVSTISSGCHRAAVRAQGGRWHGNARVPLGRQPCRLRPALVKHCPRPTQALIGPDGGMLCWQSGALPRSLLARRPSLSPSNLPKQGYRCDSSRSEGTAVPGRGLPPIPRDRCCAWPSLIWPASSPDQPCEPLLRRTKLVSRPLLRLACSGTHPQVPPCPPSLLRACQSSPQKLPCCRLPDPARSPHRPCCCAHATATWPGACR